MVRPDHIVASARSYLGTPWRHMRHSRLGMDCWGLVRACIEDNGIDLTAFGVTIPRRYGRVAAESLYAEVERVCQRSLARAGAMVWFKFPGNAYPRHFGILTPQMTVIHAEAQQHRKVIEHGFRATWLDHASGCWLIPGVTYE